MERETATRRPGLEAVLALCLLWLAGQLLFVREVEPGFSGAVLALATVILPLVLLGLAWPGRVSPRWLGVLMLALGAVAVSLTWRHLAGAQAPLLLLLFWALPLPAVVLLARRLAAPREDP